MSAIPARTVADGVSHSGIRSSRNLKPRWIPALLRGPDTCVPGGARASALLPGFTPPTRSLGSAQPTAPPRPAAPVSLAPAASASVGAAEHSFWPVRNGDALHSNGGGIHSRFTASGAMLRVARGTLDLSLTAVGHGERLHSVPVAAPAAAQNQVLYDRGAIDELYPQRSLRARAGLHREPPTADGQRAAGAGARSRGVADSSAERPTDPVSHPRGGHGSSLRAARREQCGETPAPRST